MKVDQKYWPAHLELARMYIHGWGAPQDTRKGAAILKELIKNTDDDEIKNIARFNLEVANEIITQT